MGTVSVILSFISKKGKSKSVEQVSHLVCDDQPEKYIWERGCIVRCELSLKLPLYFAVNNPTRYLCCSYGRLPLREKKLGDKFRDRGGGGMLMHELLKMLNANLKQFAYIIEAGNKTSSGGSEPIVLHGSDLDMPVELPRNAFVLETAEESYAKSLSCKYFLSETKNLTSSSSVEKENSTMCHCTKFSNHENGLEPLS